MADSDIARYGRKVISYLFDSAPRNDVPDAAPIYCLGVQYNTRPISSQENGNLPPVESNKQKNNCNDDPASFVNVNHPTPPDSTVQDSELTDEPEEITRSQLDPGQQRSRRVLDEKTSVASQDKDDGSIVEVTEDEGGWPSAFLDDFESRIWMTYSTLR